MKPFKSFYGANEIVSYLCRLRVGVASSRNKKHLIHLLTKSKEFNYHINDSNKLDEASNSDANEFIKYEAEFLRELNQLFPARKKWIKLGKPARINKRTNQLYSAADKNYFSLVKTIKVFRKKSPNEPWLLKLDTFIVDVQSSINSGTYRIGTPSIYPKLKDKKTVKGPNKCRPISLYPLKDRIILSITNKFLTQIFDECFLNCSYAFRAKKNSEGVTVSHHDCIDDILRYKALHVDTALWVFECDMEKFYDSVNHRILKLLYKRLLKITERKYPSIQLQLATNIFWQYLKSYSFNKSVFPLNNDPDYWRRFNIKNGSFEWVDKQLINSGLYKSVNGSSRIGVPQGGALSGFIANVIMHFVDKAVVTTNAFYARFCDDMVIMHEKKDVCDSAKNKYLAALQKFKLVPHLVKLDAELKIKRVKRSKKFRTQETVSPFWNIGKTKGPYKWTSISDGGFPWIGFVGYEMHFSGHVRVRKRSLLKEMRKQKDVVAKIRKAIKVGSRKKRGYITESAIHRLVGMSVGRVSLRNYKVISHELCWANGFRALNDNRYSIEQIKQLDRNRNKVFYKLESDLKKLEGETDAKKKSRQIIHFDKPFSYYYQVIERMRLKNSK